MKHRVEHVRVSGKEPPLKPGYTRYRIGNALRGPMELVARTDREAWTKGTRRVRALLKTSPRLPKQKPTEIVLYLEREVPMVITDRMRRDFEKRGQALPTDWTPVIGGFSNDPWPKDI